MKKILLLVITGLGFYIFSWCCWVMLQSHQAMHWPKAQGTVISSALRIGHWLEFWDKDKDPIRWYGVEVKYEYTVGDGRYSSQGLTFLDIPQRNPRHALQLLKKYRHSHDAIVYYDPQRPQRSFLEPGETGDLYLPFLIGGLLIVLGLTFLLDQPVNFEKSKGNILEKGQALQKQGKLEEAIWQYNDLIRMDPYYVMGYIARGSLYLQEEDWDEAIADFNRALGLEPKNGLVYFDLGSAYSGKKQYDQAWDHMQKAMENGVDINPEILEEIKKHLR